MMKSIPASEGWDIVLITIILTGTLTIIFWNIYGASEIGMMAFLDILRQWSLPVFLLAFLAHPLYQLYPNGSTAWLLVNRRYLGLSLLVIYGYYAIGCFELKRIAGHWGLNGLLLGANVVAYVLLILMALTSFHFAYRILPRRWWYKLQNTAMYGIWAFLQLVFFAEAQSTAEWYDWGLALLPLVAIVIRLYARNRGYRSILRRPVAATPYASCPLLPSDAQPHRF